MSTPTSLKRQAPLNLSLNLIHFGINLLIGIWLTPYLVRTLGASAYGLIPLALIVSDYVSLATNSINGAIARFLTEAIQQQRLQEASRIFCTAFFGLVIIVTVIAIPLLVLSLNVDHFLHVPLALISDTAILFVATSGGIILSVFSSIYSSSLYAVNRLDLCRIIDISRITSRLVLIVSLFLTFTPSLRYVGYANLWSGGISLATSLALARSANPFLRLRFSAYDPSQLKELLGFGGWAVLAQLGALLFARLDLLFANLLVGAEEAGRFAAVQQWNIVISSFAMLFAGLSAPVIVILYARNQHDQLIDVARFSMKALALMVALPAGLVCGFSGPLLNVWLGEEYRGYQGLLCITMLPVVITSAIAPLYAVQMAFKRIKTPSIVMVIIGLIKIPLVFLLCTRTSLGVYGIGILGAIVWIIKCIGCNALYNSWFLHVSWRTFVTPIGLGLLCQGLVAAGAALCTHLHLVHSWSTLALWGGVVVLGTLPIVVWGFLTQAERKGASDLIASAVLPPLRHLRSQRPNA
jgi:O-antigen/teichoic acid export membrane protein